jgi:hypothetical protein
MWSSVSGVPDLDGAPTGVTLDNCRFCCDASSCDVPNIPGDDGALLQDWFNGDCYASPNMVDVIGLEGGTYQVWIYGSSTCGPFYTTWSVSVTSWGPVGGSQGHGVIVGGGEPWPGGWSGPHFGARTIEIEDGGRLHFTVFSSGYGGLAGFQLRKLEEPTLFCSGDLGLCPCGVGAPGRGCPSSFNGSGASLAATGTASISADTLVLQASGLSVSHVTFFQGSALAGEGLGTPFGDGLLCAGGSVVRLGHRLATGGVATLPGPSETPLSVRGAVPPGGGLRTYQVWYRNPAPYCTSATFNTTNGVALLWQP